MTKSELNGLFKLSRVASGDVALTLEPVNAGHLRLERSYLSCCCCSWNGKLEKDFMLWSPWLKSYYMLGANDPVRRRVKSLVVALSKLAYIKGSTIKWSRMEMM